ncbi:LytR/AlgR family response regulator transcription factor [Pontibacter locisalis]|uniref:LytR/AlgR family response regulator transcription factor n=1 Tax=Pontibacter locisalis TaxID=1719035 RepID=A0ABW5ING9_9BACT
MKCFIIDDEPLAIEVIQSHVDTVEGLNVVGTFENAIDAFHALQKNPVDLIFLDIQMPKLTGLELLRSLSHPPKVIITTAFREYAFEGFELDVVDFLLKPVSLERFLKSIAKVLKSEQNTSVPSEMEGSLNDSCLFVQVDKKTIKLYFKDILYIESQKNSVEVVTEAKKIQVRQKISDLDKELSQKGFVRTHRAFLVPIDRVESWSATELEVSDRAIPIGRTYKNDVLKQLQDYYDRKEYRYEF